MKNTISNFNKTTLFFLFILLSAFTVLITPNISSASTAGFIAGRIIDDDVFTNSNSMSVQQIQDFLNSKVPVCDNWGTNGSTPTSRRDYVLSKGYALPMTCLKEYTENGLTTAQIIYNVSQQYQINPQVLIVLLQKEQGLVTDDWPTEQQYRSATGYGCPDTAPCDSQYYGLTNQITWSGKMFRAIMDNRPTWYTPYVLGDNSIRYSPDASCGSSIVNIQNRATQALYNYTPYQPNQAALDAGWGSVNCGAYGNRNFYSYFTDWFGSPYSTFYNGMDYAPVFDATYYLNKYPDLKAAFGGDYIATLSHFVTRGMSEGRQAKSSFNVDAYKNTYQDLRIAFRNNLAQYYLHYIHTGSKEGRTAVDNPGITYITSFNGVDYSAVYDFSTYISNYADIQAAFSTDDASAIEHFVNFGMKEGRQAISSFNVSSYINRYPDLRRCFGSDLSQYYIHYMLHGKNEGRVATGDEYNGTSIYNNVDYSNVYDYSYYIANNPDVKAVYGGNDTATISHFVNFGMKEGRQAISSFNVNTYRNRYPDLSQSIGNDLPGYYLHYMYFGKSEGRTAI